MRKDKKLLTVITPTYNRATYLKNLYVSLVNQTDKDFVWLIVDDGSTDNTKNIISSFAKEDKIQINYLYKKNGGKHTALNEGIKTISTPLTFIVDSDDELTADAIATISGYYQKYKNHNICGFSFLRKFTNGSINGKLFTSDELISNHFECRINKNDYSDKAEVFFTKCLQEFPFPTFPNERFLGEDVVWAKMAQKYNMVYINKAIYISEYLETGLTKNRRINNIKSPNGCMLRANGYLVKDVNIIFREKCALQYLIYGWFAEKSTIELIKNANQKWIIFINIIPAKIFYIKWKHDFN